MSVGVNLCLELLQMAARVLEIAAADDPGHVRPVFTSLRREGARGCRARPRLHGLAIRTVTTGANFCARITGFLDEASCQEGMYAIDP